MRKKRPPLPILQILFMIFFIGLGAVIYFFWQNGKYGKFDRFNVVVQGAPVTVVSLDSKEHTLTVVRFPDDFYVSEVVPNYGAYKISSVYRVGELDHRGGQVLSWTVSDLLGIPIDGFMATTGKIGAIKGFFMQPNVIFKSQSDLNLLDRLRFIFALEQIRFDKVTEVDLEKNTSPLVLADGSSAKSMDKDQLDSLFGGYFVEAAIRDEGKRVEVINTTTVVGLGTRLARTLSNIGLSVVNVGSANGEVGQCEVRAVKNDLNLFTVRRLAKDFSCKIAARESEDRADISLILGSDFADKFKK